MYCSIHICSLHSYTYIFLSYSFFLILTLAPYLIILHFLFNRPIHVYPILPISYFKFAGDAIEIVWAVDERESADTGGFVSPNLYVATLRAAACATAMHKVRNGSKRAKTRV